jgi:hypothetical protein
MYRIIGRRQCKKRKSECNDWNRYPKEIFYDLTLKDADLHVWLILFDVLLCNILLVSFYQNVLSLWI